MRAAERFVWAPWNEPAEVTERAIAESLGVDPADVAIADGVISVRLPPRLETVTVTLKAVPHDAG